jgi:hypothetical protein
LGDVFARSGGKEAGIDHKDLPVADDHGAVAADEPDVVGGVLDLIHTIGELSYFSLRLAEHWGDRG